MKLVNIISLLEDLPSYTDNANFRRNDIEAAKETLQEILKLKNELRRKFDPDKLNRLYLLIEGKA